MRTRRWIIFAVAAIGFFIIALNGEIYNLTSPPSLSWHVVLRKSYSIVAFALVGAAYTWASGASIVTTALVVAFYSGLIEVGQKVTYHHEPLLWNAIDVVFGAVGGALGPLIPGTRAK